MITISATVRQHHACIILAALILSMGWPGMASAEIVSLPVPRGVIYPGQAINKDIVVLRRYRGKATEKLPIIRRLGELNGKVARRTLLPGRLIPLSSIRNPYLVKHGKKAILLFESKLLTIQAKGVALESGGAGDVVQVRNLDSGSVVSGVVVANGIIKVSYK